MFSLFINMYIVLHICCQAVLCEMTLKETDWDLNKQPLLQWNEQSWSVAHQIKQSQYSLFKLQTFLLCFRANRLSITQWEKLSLSMFITDNSNRRSHKQYIVFSLNYVRFMCSSDGNGNILIQHIVVCQWHGSILIFSLLHNSQLHIGYEQYKRPTFNVLFICSIEKISKRSRFFGGRF